MTKASLFLIASALITLSAPVCAASRLSVQQPVSHLNCNPSDVACVEQDAVLNALRNGTLKEPLVAHSTAECDNINFAGYPRIKCIVQVVDDTPKGEVRPGAEGHFITTEPKK